MLLCLSEIALCKRHFKLVQWLLVLILTLSQLKLFLFQFLLVLVKLSLQIFNLAIIVTLEWHMEWLQILGQILRLSFQLDKVVLLFLQFIKYMR